MTTHETAVFEELMPKKNIEGDKNWFLHHSFFFQTQKSDLNNNHQSKRFVERGAGMSEDKWTEICGWINFGCGGRGQFNLKKIPSSPLSHLKKPCGLEEVCPNKMVPTPKSH